MALHTIIERHQVSAQVIFDYFTKNQGIFSPPLASRVNLIDFSQKIEKYANHYWLKINGNTEGLIACYANDFVQKSAFITSISISSKFQGQKLAKPFLEFVIFDLKAIGFKTIKLEVYSQNKKAISFYNAIGFITIEQRQYTKILMLNI